MGPVRLLWCGSSLFWAGMGLSHVFENEELKDNVSFTCYPAGHMFYLFADCPVQFRQDAEAWFREEH